jgi:hypothetical protein
VVSITSNYIKRRIKKDDVNAEPMLSAYPEIQAEQEAKMKAEDAAQTSEEYAASTAENN